MAVPLPTTGLTTAETGSTGRKSPPFEYTAGFLQKSQYTRRWKERFGLLRRDQHGSTLRSYSSKDAWVKGEKALISIDLFGASMKKLDSKKSDLMRSFKFEITTEKNETFIYKLKTREQRKNWMIQINRVIRNVNRRRGGSMDEPRQLDEEKWGTNTDRERLDMGEDGEGRDWKIEDDENEDEKIQAWRKDSGPVGRRAKSVANIARPGSQRRDRARARRQAAAKQRQNRKKKKRGAGPKAFSDDEFVVADREPWKCIACTFENHVNQNRCMACDAKRDGTGADLSGIKAHFSGHTEDQIRRAMAHQSKKNLKEMQSD